VANPTYFTIRTYARALGKRVAWQIEEEVSSNGRPLQPEGSTPA
jgi:hypothetical protein